MMFSKNIFVVAVLILAAAGPLAVTAIPVESTGSTMRGIVTTRHCEGNKIMEKKRDEKDNIKSIVVFEYCKGPLMCVVYGNGQVKCGKPGSVILPPNPYRLYPTKT